MDNKEEKLNTSKGDTKIQKIEKIRVHYFFTTEKDIDQALKEMRINIRITKGDKWKKIELVANPLSLHDFSAHVASNSFSFIQPKSIYLFDSKNTNYAILQVKISS